jgi:DNA-binding GntR family transcriptional regulator
MRIVGALLLENPLAGRQSSPRLIAAALRAAIIHGRLAPDAPLRQEQLARHFSVSRIPLREALRQLESEGWIEFLPHRGARVSRLDAAEAREIFEIRAALECTALKLAAPRHTRASWQEVAQLLSDSRRESRRSRYVRRNRDFHLALYRPAQRPRLLALITSLHDRGERYLRLKLDIPAYKQQSDAEHVQLFDAASGGHIAQALRILEGHLVKTGEMLAGCLGAPPARARHRGAPR